MFQNVIEDAIRGRLLIIRVLQYCDGHILRFPAGCQRLYSLREFLLTDVVVDEDKIRTEPHQSFNKTAEIKGNFSNNPPSIQLINLFQCTRQINWVIPDKENIQGLRALSDIHFCFHGSTIIYTGFAGKRFPWLMPARPGNSFAERYFSPFCRPVKKIAIIGGGLAGLITSIQLVRAGNACTVYEKKSYPLHRVCGEYVSNEALPFLTSSGLLPNDPGVSRISSLVISSVTGRSCKIDLDLGGFGISRYAFENFLYRVAVAEGVEFCLNTEVGAVDFHGDHFELHAMGQTHTPDVVVGAFGKRSRLDVQQNRLFMKSRSPWVGVKYHAHTSHPSDVIALHNFSGGYCGICCVEGGVTNICYLTHRDNLRRYGDISRMEREVMFRNPSLRRIFQESTFLFERAQVINEISFAAKAPVENHILMAGDAAGMITPLCGNGMAMAIHSGKMVSEAVNAFAAGRCTRSEMEEAYRRDWGRHFRNRLAIGRQVQRLFGKTFLSSLLVGCARALPSVATAVIRRTHGCSF